MVSAADEKLAGIYDALAPWSVLAASSLITSCAGKTFGMLDLLVAAVQINGVITQTVPRTGQALFPNWYPATEAVIETAGGEIYTKLKEVPIATRAEPATEPGNAKMTKMLIDLSQAHLSPGTTTFTLTYSPWFRFVTDPARFNIVGRTAAYVAECFHFMCARSGISAKIKEYDDRRDLMMDCGLRVEIYGMKNLSKIRLVAGEAESSFDLVNRSIEIDERMFPSAYEAGCAVLKTGGKLINMSVIQDQHRVNLVYSPESGNV